MILLISFNSISDINNNNKYNKNYNMIKKNYLVWWLKLI